MNGPTDNIDGSTQSTYEDSPGALGFVVTTSSEHGKEFIRYDVFVAALFKQMEFKLMALHAALGVCGEAGELADAIKKEYIYNKPRDRANIVEELGDLRFFIQAVMNLYKITEQEVLQENFNKLLSRYKGLSYSDDAAIARADKSTGMGK